MHRLHRLLPLLILFSAVPPARGAEPLLGPSPGPADALDAAPAGWELTAGTAPWTVREAPEAGPAGRALASTGVQENSSFLLRRFTPPQSAYVLRFRAQAQSDTSKRGLSWGLSQGAPTAQAARAFHLAFGPAGKLSYFDGAAWQGAAPLEAGRWYTVEVTAWPADALYVISLDGRQVTPDPLPFWHSVTPDTLFIHNYAAGPEGAEILVGGIELVPTDAKLPAGTQTGPRGLRVTNLAPDRVDLDWLAPETPPAGYRVYRNGVALRDLPGDATRFTDAGLRPSTLYIYKLAYLDGETPPVESRLSEPAADWTLPPAGTNAPRGDAYDVLVVGATPGGISAAIAAAQLGATVALVEPSPWIGGMMAGGLSNTDFRFKETHGGYFKEVVREILDYYRVVYGADSRQVRVSNEGYKFEPRVARAVLTRLLAQERNVSLFRQLRATGVKKQGKRITAVTFEDLTGGPARTFTGKSVIDATYEGDIAAFAGVPYRVGRESKGDFGEQHAGELYWDMDQRKIVWGVGSGAGDHRIQAYNYRLIMTNRADNRVPFPRPEGYDRAPYAQIAVDANRQRTDGKGPYATFWRVLGEQGRLPNDKLDVNNSSMYWPSTDFVGGNYDYPEANWARREEIIRAHQRYIQGLLYFLQNDPELPEAFRAEANRWGLARDEFVDNNNWPTQLYVREARRFIGRYWFTENDARPREGEQRSPLQPHGVGVGDYSLDSHATQPPKPEQPNLIEGFFYGGKTEPYQVPFGVMVPENVENLLMPVAVSATHIGLSTIRMEPTWMALGQAAGSAAGISVIQGTPATRVSVPLVQDVTLLDRQVVIFLRDVGYDHPDFRGLNYAGLIGLFPTYQAEPDKALDRATTAQWLWQWMRARSPKLRAPANPPQFADIAADAPYAEAAGVLGAIEAMGKVGSGESFRPAEPLTAGEAARWIARAHRASDVWNATQRPDHRDWLEGRITQLLVDVVRDNPRMSHDSLTRGQFLTLLYLAARTATGR